MREIVNVFKKQKLVAKMQQGNSGYFSGEKLRKDCNETEKLQKSSGNQPKQIENSDKTPLETKV